MTELPRPATGPSAPCSDSLPVVDGRRVGSLQDAYDGRERPSGALAPTLPVGHLVDDLSAHAPMMAAHLAVAALVGLWLGVRRALPLDPVALTGRRILAAAGPCCPSPVAIPAPRRSTTAPRAAPVRPRSVWLVRPHSRRGPPSPRCLTSTHAGPAVVPARSRVRARPLFEENP